MIQKISMGVTGINRATTLNSPIRSTLKAGVSKLKNLAGSGMSGGYTPSYVATEMIIPNGLSFQEKAYYLLKGKLPHSVYDRWIKLEDHVPNPGDQVVTVNISGGRYIGNIVEKPHDYVAHGDDISGGDSLTHDDLTGTLDDGGLTGSDTDLDVFEIFKHLAGFQ